MKKESHKKEYGAFTVSNSGEWIQPLKIKDVIIMGFYAHGYGSTTTREAIVLGFNAYLHRDTTGACDIEHRSLGKMAADEMRRSALPHLANMGAVVL